MNVTVSKVKLQDKPILANLLEKYLYEFSQYDGCQFDNQGLFQYKYLDNYWTEDKLAQNFSLDINLEIKVWAHAQYCKSLPVIKARGTLNTIAKIL